MKARLTALVVAHTRQALQHAGAIGAYSAARFASGSVRVEARSSTGPSVRRPSCRGAPRGWKVSGAGPQRS